MAFSPSKSYPYLSVANHMELPYWVVISARDQTATGLAARKFITNLRFEFQNYFWGYISQIERGCDHG